MKTITIVLTEEQTTSLVFGLKDVNDYTKNNPSLPDGDRDSIIQTNNELIDLVEKARSMAHSA